MRNFKINHYNTTSVGQRICVKCLDHTFSDEGSTRCDSCPKGSDPDDVRRKMMSQGIKEILIEKCLSKSLDLLVLFKTKSKKNISIFQNTCRVI